MEYDGIGYLILGCVLFVWGFYLLIKTIKAGK